MPNSDKQTRSIRWLALLLPALMMASSCAKPRFDLVIKDTGRHFAGKLVATSLRTNSPYVLSINGKVGQDGNDALRAFGEFGGEGYHDFAEEHTDTRGTLAHEFAVSLPPGAYDVTFLLKDKSANHKTIFSRNHVRFRVTP